MMDLIKIYKRNEIIKDYVNIYFDDEKSENSNKNLSYKILHIIGNGVYGVVYKADCLNNCSIVALKQTYQKSTRIFKEIEIMKKLKHPNIVKLKHAFYTSTNDGGVYVHMVMEYGNTDLASSLYYITLKDSKEFLKDSFDLDNYNYEDYDDNKSEKDMLPNDQQKSDFYYYRSLPNQNEEMTADEKSGIHPGNNNMIVQGMINSNNNNNRDNNGDNNSSNNNSSNNNSSNNNSSNNNSSNNNSSNNNSSSSSSSSSSSVLNDVHVNNTPSDEDMESCNYIKNNRRINIINHFKNSFFNENINNICSCHNISDFIKKSFLNENQIKIYLYQLIRATLYLHSLCITHRDIKPQNILIFLNKTNKMKTNKTYINNKKCLICIQNNFNIQYIMKKKYNNQFNMFEFNNDMKDTRDEICNLDKTSDICDMSCDDKILNGDGISSCHKINNYNNILYNSHNKSTNEQNYCEEVRNHDHVNDPCYNISNIKNNIHDKNKKENHTIDDDIQGNDNYSLKNEGQDDLQVCKNNDKKKKDLFVQEMQLCDKNKYEGSTSPSNDYNKYDKDCYNNNNLMSNHDDCSAKNNLRLKRLVSMTNLNQRNYYMIINDNTDKICDKSITYDDDITKKKNKANINKLNIDKSKNDIISENKDTQIAPPNNSNNNNNNNCGDDDNFNHDDLPDQQSLDKLYINSLMYKYIKLCDFNTSIKLKENYKYFSYVCSRYYRAPELLFGSNYYSQAIDTWSIGCVMGELLLGKPLFLGECASDQLVEIIKILGTPNDEDFLSFRSVYKNIKFPDIKPITLEKVIRHNCSKESLDLLSELLQFNPQKRIKLCHALLHNYFDDIRNLKVFQKDINTFDKYKLPYNTNCFNFTKEELLHFTIEERKILIPQHVRQNKSDEVMQYIDMTPDHFDKLYPNKIHLTC
ncbi:CMGC/GSK protein kinase [Plasmodium falciparum Tanzania (2000708)]|uniref:CMGC/GSK protein kinase n=1 Tax=Plasmodium falciparum Tanzania (2000708) TaxID=1036725 RepID=A0A024W973_PLAFA|nr:CMGC/GSK protein kinase [Plasmodium falciparum Tanzania (2000708)]